MDRASLTRYIEYKRDEARNQTDIAFRIAAESPPSEGSHDKRWRDYDTNVGRREAYDHILEKLMIDELHGTDKEA
jgi:hypothetical protein